MKLDRRKVDEDLGRVEKENEYNQIILYNYFFCFNFYALVFHPWEGVRSPGTVVTDRQL